MSRTITAALMLSTLAFAPPAGAEGASREAAKAPGGPARPLVRPKLLRPRSGFVTGEVPHAPTCSDAKGQTISCSCCTIDMQYFGGHLIANPKVYAVFWTSGVDAEVQTSMGPFYAAATNSPYMDWRNEYNTDIDIQTGGSKPGHGTDQIVGRGVLGGAVTITPLVSTSSTLTDGTPGDFTAELEAQIQAGHLPAPDANTIYMLHFPPGYKLNDGSGGASCGSFCAYHSTWVYQGKSAYYSVIPDQNHDGCERGCGNGTPLANTTATSSHELVEAITDAEVGLASGNAAPLGWYDSEPQASNQGEVGDMCNQFSDTKAVTGYTVQQIYSQATGNCQGTRFDDTDFSVSLATNTAGVKGGASVTVPITTAKTGAGSGPAQRLGLSVLPGSLPPGVTAAITPATVTAGDPASLVLTAVSGVTAVSDALPIVLATPDSGRKHSAALLLQVGAGTTTGSGDFTLSVTPSSQTLINGSLNSAVVYTVKATFTGTAHPVDLSVSGVPSGLQSILFDSTLTPASGSPTASTTLTLTDLLGTAPAGGPTTFTITGSAGSTTHTATGAVSIHGKPTVAFTTPANNATLSGSVLVKAHAVAGVGTTLQSVSLKLDGSVDLGINTTSAEPTFTWDTTSFVGSHTLSLVVTDADGGTASSPPSINVTVTAPVVNDWSIAIAPASASVNPGKSATFTVTTAVASGAAEEITFSTQGLPAGLTWAAAPAKLTGSGTATLTVTAPAGMAAVASTTFSVIGKSATVTAGHGASAAIAVVVPVIPPPAVTLTAPGAGTVSGVITVSAAAVVASTLALQSLTLYDGTAVIASTTSATSTASLSAQWDTNLVPNGSHTLTAQATDSSGVSGTSAPVLVTVNNTAVASDFAVAISGAQSVARGASAAFTVTVTALGTAPTVKLSVAGLAAGVTGSLSPDTVLAGNTSTLTLAASSTAALGQTTFVVVGAVGTTTRSAPGTLTVTAGTTGGGKLAVAITSPNDGATVTGQVAFTAVATLALGTTLSKIDFFVDGSAAGSSATSPGTVTWDATSATAGAHSLSVKVHDSAGSTATSAVVSVNVGAANAPAGGCASPGGSGLPALLGLLALGLRRRGPAPRAA